MTLVLRLDIGEYWNATGLILLVKKVVSVHLYFQSSQPFSRVIT